MSAQVIEKSEWVFGATLSGMRWVSLESWGKDWWLYIGYSGEREVEFGKVSRAEAQMLLDWAREMYWSETGRFSPDLHGWTWWVG